MGERASGKRESHDLSLISDCVLGVILTTEGVSHEDHHGVVANVMSKPYHPHRVEVQSILPIPCAIVSSNVLDVHSNALSTRVNGLPREIHTTVL